MSEVTVITKQQRDELVHKHEETVRELEKALLLEQKRQQNLMHKLKQKKKHQLAYHEEYEYYKYQENARKLQRKDELSIIHEADKITIEPPHD